MALIQRLSPTLALVIAVALVIAIATPAATADSESQCWHALAGQWGDDEQLLDWWSSSACMPQATAIAFEGAIRPQYPQSEGWEITWHAERPGEPETPPWSHELIDWWSSSACMPQATAIAFEGAIRQQHSKLDGWRITWHAERPGEPESLPPDADLKPWEVTNPESECWHALAARWRLIRPWILTRPWDVAAIRAAGNVNETVPVTFEVVDAGLPPGTSQRIVLSRPQSGSSILLGPCFPEAELAAMIERVDFVAHPAIADGWQLSTVPCELENDEPPATDGTT